MNTSTTHSHTHSQTSAVPEVRSVPIQILRGIWLALYGTFYYLLWVPIRTLVRILDEHWLSYVRCRRTYDETNQLVSVRWVHYGDFIHAHVLTWASLVFWQWAKNETAPHGWLLFSWALLLFTVIYALVKDMGWRELKVFALWIISICLGAWVSTLKHFGNPFHWIYDYVVGLNVTVSANFYLLSAWFSAAIWIGTAITAWIHNRVELDKSYIQMRRFPFGNDRVQIYARDSRRNSADLIELVLSVSADFVVSTQRGTIVFKNVLFAGWGRVAAAIDRVIDFRSVSQAKRDRQVIEETQSRPEDAHGSEVAADTTTDMQHEHGVQEHETVIDATGGDSHASGSDDVAAHT